MAYDPAYSKPTWSSEELVTSTKLNQMVDNTEHNYKYKPELGPDAPSGVKIACGQKAVVFNNESSKSATVTFATDSDHGDPGFSNTPRIVITRVKGDPDVNPWGKNVDNASNTSFDIEIGIDDTGTLYTGTQYVDWIAIGQ